MIDIKIPPVILNLFASISLYHTFFCPSNLGRRQRANDRKIQNCVAQIEEGCLKTVAERLGDRIEELEPKNKRIDKKLKRLHNNVSDVPDYDEIEALKDNFIHYMQEKNNLPIRKEFLQKVIEKIKITDNEVEIVFNL